MSILFRSKREARRFPSPLTLVLCLLCSSLTAAARVQTQQYPDDVIRTETDLTNVLLTATDKQNRLITTLREEDVRVLEDGVPQKLFTFQRETDRPLSIAFLIDVSASEERTLPDEKASRQLADRTGIKPQSFLSPITRFSNRP